MKPGEAKDNSGHSRAKADGGLNLSLIIYNSEHDDIKQKLQKLQSKS